MRKTLRGLGVTVDVPEGTDVTEDGSIFGPEGVELALYADRPGAQASDRQQVIEGRSYVKAWGATELLPDGSVRMHGLMDETADGWFVLFETEDGELGFEIGRRRPDRTVVFWGDRLRDARAREQAIAIARGAELS